MTDEQKQARGLIELLGHDKALGHVDFVLSEQFRLDNDALRIFWLNVRRLIVKGVKV